MSLPTPRRVLGAARARLAPAWQRRVHMRREFDRIATELHQYKSFYERVEAAGLVNYLNEDLQDTARFLIWAPPGHFYSAIPSWKEVDARAGTTFDKSWRELPGIPIDEDEHAELLETLAPLWADLDELDGEGPEPGTWRYGLDNDAFNRADARALYGLLRHLKPKRIVEVGSGYSSALMLDAIDRHLDPQPEVTLVEPYPELVESLLWDGDEERIEIVGAPVQEVDLERFTSLESGDVLFIDDTHVSKVGSDVNHLFFEVLPRIAPGVWVHVHDVFFPFEYPHAWVEEGRAWTEQYVLRAFLIHNEAYRVAFFPDAVNCSPRLAAMEQGEVFHGGCGSIWLRRI